jgi:cytoskeleton protein RodZ
MLKRRRKPPVVPQQSGGDSLAAIGAELRAARTARGEELSDIAAYLRIRPGYLEALEAGEAARLPARAYAIGFLRAYADGLELDGSALAARLKAVMEPAPALELAPRETIVEHRRPTAALLAASLLLVAGIYGGYQLLSGGPHELPERVAEVPAPPSAPPASLPAEVRPRPAPAEPAPMIVATEPVAVEPQAPVIPPAADVTSAVAAETPEGEAAIAASRPIAVLDVDAAPPLDPDEIVVDGRVVILARESSWVQVRSAARDWVRTRTLQPGERFALPDRADLALWTGNAGGIELLVDGQSVGVVGAPGAVVKDLALTPDSLKLRTAASAAAAAAAR